MVFDKLKKDLKEGGTPDLLRLFDRVAYTLGFSSLKAQSHDCLDTEAALAASFYLFGKGEPRLARFVGPLLQWLSRHHRLLNAQKLLKMGRSMETSFGPLPVMRLAFARLYALDPKRFKNLKPHPLEKPFYLEPRLKELVDMELESVGFMDGLTKSLGLMFPKGAFKEKESDLVDDARLFRRNSQLRMRHLLGANYRSDVAVMVKTRPSLSARELSRTLLLSYEPAHRLVQEMRECEKMGLLPAIEERA